MHAVQCTLDVPKADMNTSQGFASHRRRSQRTCAQRIAQHRILNQSSRAEVVSRCDTHYMIDQNGYTSVAFLNKHDIVLGADQFGRIDIVRLPRYGSDGSAEVLGTRLATKVELRPFCEKLSFVKLKSFHNGEAFAVGLPTGEFRVFATEHAYSWRTEHYNKGNDIQQRFIPEPRFNLDGWRFLGPRRRYHRDFLDSSRALLNMLDNHRGSPVMNNMSQVMDWNDNDSLSRPSDSHNWLRRTEFLPGGFPSFNDDARWDFRETPSGLHAAFVDQERDCFSILFLDDRTNSNSRRPKLMIDTDSRDDARLCQEDVTSICFVSDNYLVTSHVWKKPNQRNPTNALKLWDIRMASTGRYGKHLVENVLPSFPLDSVSRASADTTWLAKVNSDDAADCQLISHDVNTDWSCPFSVTRLSSSAEGVGTVMVTLQSISGPKLMEHLIFDPCEGKVVHRHRSIKAGLPSCNVSSPVFTVSASHDLFASYQIGDHSGNSKLCFHTFSPPRRNERKPSMKMSRKRSKDDFRCESKEDEQGFMGDISPNVFDRDGIPSRITALAFNDTSTSLVGGTLDGDIFVWRGG